MTVGTSRKDSRWPSAGEWIAAGTNGRPADLALLGVPTHATSLSPTGAHKTPTAVRQALLKLSTWSPSRRIDLSTMAALDLGNVDDPDLGDEGEWRVTIAAESGATLARLLVVIGGDNSLTAPLGRGALADLKTAGLVTLDAHLDIREGRSNGSPVRRLLDSGMVGERIVQVGIADWANSRSYADEAYARGLHAVYRSAVETRGIAECVREALDTAAAGGGGVLVDLDLDVCDRAVAPGCPASLPGGLTAREVLTAAYLAGCDPRVHAVDITEVDATADPDGRTVRLAALCVLEIAAGLASRRVEPV
ncbi:MAG: arginase family protein [Actinomycetota bacterium]